MLWFVVAPFVYPFLLLSVCVIAITLLAPKRNRKRVGAFFAGIGISIVLFVPICYSIYHAMNPFRFGTFQYDKHADISSRKVSRWVPTGATNITVNQHMGGFDAMYSIRSAELNPWLDKSWASFARELNQERGEEPIGGESPKKDAANLGWNFPADTSVHEGPRARSFAGFTNWLSDSEGVAYQDAGYW